MNKKPIFIAITIILIHITLLIFVTLVLMYSSANPETVTVRTEQTSNNTSVSPNVSTITTLVHNLDKVSQSHSEVKFVPYNPCPKNLKPITVNNTVYCSLDIPYINQTLNSKGAFTQDPSGRDDVNYMCTAASEVMIAGYYSKIKYSSSDELREHLYNPLSSPGLVAGNTVNVSGYNITLCTDGAFGISSYDPSTGISYCDWNKNVEFYPQYLGLNVNEIPVDYDTVVNSINSGNPILFFISPYDELAGGIYEAHFVVVKGYSLTDHQILLNDPFRDMNVKVNGLCAGLSSEASLTGENSVFNMDYYECTVANAMYKIF